MNRAKQLAKHEVGWWKAHHRRNVKELLGEMAKLYCLQFRISYGKALEAAERRVRAAQEHDTAEKFEDQGKMKLANQHWRRAELFIEEHFKILESLTSAKK
jgi:hypothetical protein